MEHHLAVGQRTDWLAIFADIGDEHDAGQHLGEAWRPVFGRPGKLAELAKKSGRADEIFLRKLLTGKHQDKMVEPGLIDGPHGLRGGLFPQIDATQLCADVPTQRNDLEFRLGK
jgi:hypothetical protein